ncbi:hypothetical protein [Acidovorax sp. sic0104]|uniref:hypothetical protein n=1 Tax=Acidovorax sp. sic0104 TaxID=2854784 RepID=UPI001C438B78|nr:hypothetical protein [Acidovorax sp. sic0104]MBV7540501.1 hypothetical protein [Acidovorax sp. sic0104]
MPSASTSAPAATHTAPDIMEPSPAQQKVLDSIASQRSRLRARRAARAQSLALTRQPGPVGGIDESLVLRAAGFAREHPLAVVAMAGVGLLAGPRRLVRWAGVLLPMLMRLRR